MPVLVNPPNEPVLNAQLFIYDRFTMNDELLLRSHAGFLRVWEGNAWRKISSDDLLSKVYLYFQDAEYKVLTETHTTIVPFRPNEKKVKEIVSATSAVTHLPDDESMPFWIDENGLVVAGPSPHELVPMANGLLRVDDRVLLPPTPRFFCPYALPYDYDPEAPPPERWYQFLNELWPDDQESKDLLQEFIGYLLVPDTSQQKMLLVVGPPRSGKGTISRMTRDLVGHHNFAGPTLAGLGTNFGLQPMIDKPVAIISDARLSGRENNATVVERLLSISGEDPLTIDRKYKTAWVGPLPTRLIILTNEVPRLDDASGALANRFLILQMTESFLGAEDPTLSAQLRKELPGILLWALDGLDRLRERGHFVVPKRSDEIVRELADLSSPMRAFIRDCCVIDPLATVSVDDLFDEWTLWSRDRGVDKVTKQVFGRDLHAAVPNLDTTQSRRAGTRQRRYEGIGLARDGTRT
jgi:putative DNA primase/helicase